MFIFKKNNDLKTYLSHQQKQGHSVGFVPTMGALHEGHLTLLKAAGRQCEITVCSIFVNPTQFNDPKDYEKYPVKTDEDIRKLLETGTDIPSLPACAKPMFCFGKGGRGAGNGRRNNLTNILFLPSKEEIYPHGTANLPTYHFGKLGTVLEGAFRPGHFQGVGQVLHRLLDIVRPDVLFMGQKDYQQLLIVRKLTGLLDLKIKVESCPTLREANGLAMSSRNLRLSPEARKKAPAIYQALLFVKANVRKIPFPELLKKAKDRLTQEGFKLDYMAIADAEGLQLLEQPVNRPMIILTSAWLGDVRLIDNLLL